MARVFLIAAALFGLVAVALGAFGAHALKDALSADDLRIFETGVRYQMYHALALLLTGLASTLYPSRSLGWAGGFFIAGLVVFPGSLYLLVYSGLRAWGAVTPIGGLAFLAGWACLIVAAWHFEGPERRQ